MLSGNFEIGAWIFLKDKPLKMIPRFHGSYVKWYEQRQLEWSKTFILLKTSTNSSRNVIRSSQGKSVYLEAFNPDFLDLLLLLNELLLGFS